MFLEIDQLQLATSDAATAMERWCLLLVAVVALGWTPWSWSSEGDSPVALVVHGGAGTIDLSEMTPAARDAYATELAGVLLEGDGILTAGGSSVDAVVAVISSLEASPLFNAGVGAVMTWDGVHELDASIMSGGDLQAGAVAGVTTVRSPIRLARAVMEQSDHVMLSGSGAEAFAEQLGMAPVTNDVFTTPRRREGLERVKQRLNEQAALSEAVTPHKWGTVGAVALDHAGNLAAGTSTGGMTAKRWGRIGDSPVIGAGTYADNRSCAVSATGHGEYFIRYNVAADICARVRYQGLDIAEAGRRVLFEELLPNGGTGGVIIMDPRGNIAMPFNTQGMYRGRIDVHGKLAVGIHQEMNVSTHE